MCKQGKASGCGLFKVGVVYLQGALSAAEKAENTTMVMSGETTKLIPLHEG